MTLDDYYAELDDCRPSYEFEGEVYEDATTLLQVGFLDFCECGRPEENLTYLLKGLELIDESVSKSVPEYSTSPDVWHAWYKDYDARVRAHFGNLEAAYFFYYWADRENLTEHGGSVPGWLTPKGEKLLGLLREWAAKYVKSSTNVGEDPTDGR